MESEKKIEDNLKTELAKTLGIQKIIDFPITIIVQQDELPDIERWRKDE